MEKGKKSKRRRKAAAKKKATAPTGEHEQLLSIFDGIDEVIYIADPKSYELLYLNKAGKKLFPLKPGVKCYRAFQGRSSPCPYCANKHIFGKNPGKTHTWEFKNKRNERWYRCIDRAIKWPDGRWVRCEMAVDITETKKATEELRESAKKFKSIVERNYDTICLLDLAGRIAYISPAVEKMTGYKPREVTGTNFRKYFTKADTGRVLRVFMEIASGKTVKNFVLPMIKKYKGTLFAEANGTPVFEGGKVVGAQVIFRDVTERERSEEALKRSEARYRGIIETTQDAFWYVDDEGRFLDVNKAACEMLGYGRDELLKMKIADVETIERQTDVIRHIRKMRELGGDLFESRHKRKDGSIVDVEVVTSVLTEPDRGERVFTFVRDITERKKGERRIEMFRKFAENAGQGFGMADMEKNVIYVNPTLASMFGEKRPEDCSGKKLSDYYPPGYYQRFVKKIVPVLMAKGQWTGESEIVSAGGKIIPVIENIFVLRDEKGDPMSYANVLTDITEQKEAERTRATLLRDVTHSLKSPIAVSHMALYMSGKGLERGDLAQTKEGHEIIAGNLDMLGKDMDNLLVSATLDAKMPGEIKPGKKKRCSLKKAAGDMMTSMEKMAREKGVRFKVDIAGGANTIAMNKNHMKILINGLMDNAMKFTDKGYISLLAREKGGEVEIRVKDTGCGIEKKHIDRVFQRFYKRHPAVHGTGLGLSIAKDIVDMYGGKITVESKGRGKGTTVRVVLPKG